MPLGVKFKDSAGKRGANFRPIAPKDEITVNVRNISRSLDKLPQDIRCEWKDNKVILNLDNVVGNRIRIKQKDAIRFANWILQTLKKK